MFSKEAKREFLPAVNACLIAFLGLYFYSGDKTVILWLVSLFLVVAKITQKEIVTYWTKEITQRAHSIIFLFLTITYLYVFIPKLNEQIKQP